MTETEENTSTPKITFNRSITPGSITIPEIPTTKLTLTTTSKATPNSNQSNFEKTQSLFMNSSLKDYKQLTHCKYKSLHI